MAMQKKSKVLKKPEKLSATRPPRAFDQPQPTPYTP
jgi:hypothetical protein